MVDYPKLYIDTGGGGFSAATYESGTATDTLVFKYTIGTNDLSADLDYATTPYQFSGGQIYDGKAKKVMLILPPPGTDHYANKDLVIGTDTVAPSNVTISINNGDASTDSTKLN